MTYSYGSYSVSARPVFANGSFGAWQRLGYSYKGWSCGDCGDTEYFSRFVGAGTPKLISTVTVRKLPKPRVSYNNQHTNRTPHSWGNAMDMTGVKLKLLAEIRAGMSLRIRKGSITS